MGRSLANKENGGWKRVLSQGRSVENVVGSGSEFPQSQRGCKALDKLLAFQVSYGFYLENGL